MMHGQQNVKPRILVAVEFLLTTLEYISLTKKPGGAYVLIHCALIYFYEETNLIECKHNVRHKMTSFSGMAKRLENILGTDVNLTKSASSVVDMHMNILWQQERQRQREKEREKESRRSNCAYRFLESTTLDSKREQLVSYREMSWSFLFSIFVIRGDE